MIKKEIIMSNILIYIIFVLEVIIGVGSSLYIVVSLFATIIGKIVRKIKYGTALTD